MVTQLLQLDRNAFIIVLRSHSTIAKSSESQNTEKNITRIAEMAHLAASEGNREICELLIRNRAKVIPKALCIIFHTEELQTLRLFG